MFFVVVVVNLESSYLKVTVPSIRIPFCASEKSRNDAILHFIMEAQIILCMSAFFALDKFNKKP